MGSLSIWHILLIAVVVLVLFGGGKLSGIMGDAGKGIKAFKEGLKDDDKPADKVDTALPRAEEKREG